MENTTSYTPRFHPTIEIVGLPARSDKIILEFPLLYRGWECDTKGWIMQRRDGSKYIKLTSHGSPYVAAKEDLEAKIKEYQEAIKQTKRAIKEIEI